MLPKLSLESSAIRVLVLGNAKHCRDFPTHVSAQRQRWTDGEPRGISCSASRAAHAMLRRWNCRHIGLQLSLSVPVCLSSYAGEVRRGSAGGCIDRMAGEKGSWMVPAALCTEYSPYMIHHQVAGYGKRERN